MRKSLKRYNAVVFDFDGTLAVLNIDFPEMRRLVLNLIRSFDIPDDGLQELLALEMIESGRRWIARHDRKSREKYDSSTSSLLRRIELEGASKGRLFQGTREMFRALNSRGIKTGVVTRNCRDAVLRVFPDIEELCPAVLTRDDTEKVKPHPDHLRAVLLKLGVESARGVMVGDHPMDILVGKELGLFTIGVLSGHSGKEPLARAGADLLLEKALDILDHLS